MSVQFTKPRSFNVDEFYRMAAAGILTEDDRVELIEGEIVAMSPTGKRHTSCVKRINKRLGIAVGERAIVSVQDPVHLHDFSEPYPDLALLKPRDDFYAEAHPTPPDILLVIEVADSSLEYDREIKMALYARAEIPEALLVNLREDAIEIHSNPVNGKYQSVKTYKRGEQFCLNSVAGVLFCVDEFIG